VDIFSKIAGEIGCKTSQVEAAVKLIDEGNTIPFIARYRKEATGSLNDEQLRNLSERLIYLRNLEEKKTQVIATIKEQGKLTDELLKEIENAQTMVAVDDLYMPYRPKRRTRATIAKEKNLEPLANIILLQKSSDIEKEATKFISEEKGVETVLDAINGAKDIIAEGISDDAKFRTKIRDLTMSKGIIKTTAKDPEAASVYEMYYDFSAPTSKMSGYRTLAVNRGEKEKFINVKLEAPVEDIISYLEKNIITGESAASTSLLKEAISDSYDRLIAPAVERDIRNQLTEEAEDGAIKVFASNLHQLLMQPPITGQTVLGWDPAFRTGCKLAVVDPTGKVLHTVVIFPTEPQKKIAEAKKTVKALVKKYGITLISLGNGTASRESEVVISEIISELDTPVQYVIVNEAGASVYSASKLATEEFPNFDVGQRSAASIARRLQDPLAELVKIEPKAIGVGQYQHDMNQKKLETALDGVVESAVNKVGVDLNTASAPLMEHISGINKTLAKNIVEYRQEQGRFKSRKELLKVPKLGPKAYEQCAGFMRISEGDNPLDSTSVHPESYDIANQLLAHIGFASSDIRKGNLKNLSDKIGDIKELARNLDVGVPTLRDIIAELEKPARDPRDEMPKPILRGDILDIEDLTEGMILKGTVRNVIDFGAFVDIGVHQDGLVHISELADRYVKHPLDVVSVGDIVQVRVIGVDAKKKRIQLSMKGI
jgi:uncharacterized protein